MHVRWPTRAQHSHYSPVWRATASTVREINPFITVQSQLELAIYCRSKTGETIIKGEGLWLLINSIV